MRLSTTDRRAAVTHDGVVYDPKAIEGETEIVYDARLESTGSLTLVVQFVDANGEVVEEDLLLL